jgi:hypothetical protein
VTISLQFHDRSVTRAGCATDLDWLTWSNPVAIWWSFLVLVSVGNIALLFSLSSRYRKIGIASRAGAPTVEPLLLLGAAYVIGCAFRSILPRADVQRICLFDTWLSSVFVGRSIATVAELCFVVQWAIVLRALAKAANADTARNISKAIVPIVVLAEGCSWYAVITTDYLGNVLENSLWTAMFLFIAIALLDLLSRFRGGAQLAIGGAATWIAGYVVFMCMIDVPMYVARWQAELASSKELFGFFSGLHDVATRWVVTHDIARWKGEIAWMSLYFSAAVWASLMLASFGLMKHLLPRYRARPAVPRSAGPPLPIAVRSSRGDYLKYVRAAPARQNSSRESLRIGVAAQTWLALIRPEIFRNFHTAHVCSVSGVRQM